MPKDMTVALLLDFYGALLSEKQFDMLDMYYNSDFSLAEIAEHEGITRQGVRAAIKKGEAIILEAEEKLGLAGRFTVLVEKARVDIGEIEQLLEINQNELKIEDIKTLLMNIKTDLQYIIDNA